MRPLARVMGTVGLVAVMVAGVLAGTASASPAPGPDGLRVVTAPAIAGAVFTFDGVEYRTDARGEFTVPGAGSLADLESRLLYERFAGDPNIEVEFSRLYEAGGASATREVVAQFLESQTVTFSFVDLQGNEVSRDRVTKLVLKNSIGVEFTYDQQQLAQPQVVPSVRTVPSPTGRDTKELYYTVQEATIDGTNVVNRGQQKFFPHQTHDFSIETQFFHVEVDVSDAFFGFSSGGAVLVRWPDGAETSHPVRNGRVQLPMLPRGDYKMRVDGPGLITWRPVSVSSDQQITLELMSVYDIGAVVLVVLGLAFGLIVAGRRRVRRTRAGRAALSATAPGAEHDEPSKAPETVDAETH